MAVQQRINTRTSAAVVEIWAMDFFRALLNRPWWARFFFGFVIGKCAYREFIGMRNALLTRHPYLWDAYGLASADYHKDKISAPWWVKPPLEGG